MAQRTDGPEPRPRVTGSFVEPNDPATPLLIALGRAVFAVAGLEMSLRLEAARLVVSADPHSAEPAPGVGQALSDLEGLSAGQLLARLRDLHLPTELVDRIADVVKRRNNLVHCLFEDPELVKAATGIGNIDDVVNRIDRLAIDCGELSVELVLFAIPKLEATSGMSRPELVKLVQSVDPTTIADLHERKRVEAIQAFADAEALSSALDTVVPHAEAAEPEDGDQRPEDRSEPRSGRDRSGLSRRRTS